MYTTYHLQSADDITEDVVKAIKTAFKSKPIKVTIEEEVDATAFLMANPLDKAIIMASIEQDKKGESILVSIPEE